MMARKNKSRTVPKDKPVQGVIRDDAAKSKRKGLITQVRRSLAELTKKYLPVVAPNDQFPSEDELNLLRSTVLELYVGQGRKKRPKLEEGWDVFVQVEKRYPTLRLTNFCDRLMKKIEAIPIGPMSRITQNIERLKLTDFESAKEINEIVQFLDQDTFPSLKSRPWQNYYLLLRPFVSEGFEARLIERPTGEQEKEWLEKLKPFHGILGWAACVDIWEQTKDWQTTYDPSMQVETCRFWLRILYGEKIDARLWKKSRVDSSALPLEEHMASRAKWDAKLRKRKSRAPKS